VYLGVRTYAHKTNAHRTNAHKIIDHQTNAHMPRHLVTYPPDTNYLANGDILDSTHNSYSHCHYGDRQVQESLV